MRQRNQNKQSETLVRRYEQSKDRSEPYSTKHLLNQVRLTPVTPATLCLCSFIGSRVGAAPNITSNISVSNLMLRCEWILKQAGEAPGEARSRRAMASHRFK